MIQRTYFSFYSNFLDDSMNVNGVQASTRCLQEGKIASNFSVPSENHCGHRKLHFSQPLNLSPYIRASGAAITLNYCLGVSTSSHLRGIQIVSRRGFLLARVHLLHFTCGVDSVHLRRFQKTVRVKSILNASLCLAMVQRPPPPP